MNDDVSTATKTCSMTTTTIYPVVFIHGIFGWGKQRPFWNFGSNYWPEKDFERMNPNHIILDVGGASSDFDRAVEAFYQLVGGKVDYGKKHAEEFNHRQFGMTFKTGLYQNWNADNPIHLLGHSYGATTAIELYQLICTDFFNIGSNSSWVTSITSVAGPLSGTTLVNVVGINPVTDEVEMYSTAHAIGIIVALLWKLQNVFPVLQGIYNFRLPQWNPKDLGWTQLLNPMQHPFNLSKDTSYHCLSLSSRARRNATLVDMDKVYLFSIICDASRRRRRRHRTTRKYTLATAALIPGVAWYFLKRGKAPRFVVAIIVLVYNVIMIKQRKFDFAKMPVFSYLVWLLKSKCVDKRWEISDGIVNTFSMAFPRTSDDGDSSTAVDTPGQESLLKIVTSGYWKYQMGKWYTKHVLKNHFCGTAWDTSASALYRNLFQTFNSIENNEF